MCMGSKAPPGVPPAPPIPRLPNNPADIATSATVNQKRKAQARASGTGRSRKVTLLGGDEPVTREPVLLGR